MFQIEVSPWGFQATTACHMPFSLDVVGVVNISLRGAQDRLLNNNTRFITLCFAECIVWIVFCVVVVG